MKINEVKNNLFRLSDLKGLLNENIPAENINWGNFFNDPNNQKYLGNNYAYTSQSQFWPDKELRTAIANYPGSRYRDLADDEKITMFNKDTRDNIFNAFAKNRAKFLQQKEAQPQTQQEPEDALGQLTNGTAEESPIKQLYDFFMQGGGQSIIYSEEMETNEQLLGNYINSIIRVTDEAYKHFTQAGTPINRFDGGNMKIGYEKEPFLLFLLFYYFKYCEKRGGTWNDRVNSSDVYFSNMTPGTVSEYAKYILNVIGRTSLRGNFEPRKTVFDIVFKCGRGNLETIADKLVTAGYDGDMYAPARSMAYVKKYREVLKLMVPQPEIDSLAATFNYPSATLFDPMASIDETRVTAGLQKIIGGHGPGNSDYESILNRIIKPVLIQSEEKATPAERIFIIAKSVRNSMNIDYGKEYGASGRNVFGNKNENLYEKANLILGKAIDGIQKLEEDAVRRGYGGERMPQPINGLKEMYLSKIKDAQDLLMWRLLDRDMGSSTQDKIFIYLLSVSDPNVIWRQEYNRFEKQESEAGEGGLGGKSIDIIGTLEKEGSHSRTLCFEYQGEQHYHPVNVKPADYQYTLFSAMRDEILEGCGFSPYEKEGRKYYFGRENIDSIEAKTVIINTFKKYSVMLDSYLARNEREGGKILKKSFMVTEGSSPKSVNLEALSTFTIKEAAEYFREVAERGPNDAGVFENPPLKGMIPYLCSPCRFIDEVETAMDLERDRVKNAIISARREKSGWEIAYITPKVRNTSSSLFTATDFDYTKIMSNDMSPVFQWSDNGKKEILEYLEKVGFRTPEEVPQMQEGKRSLFQDIIKEIIDKRTT